MHKFLKTKTNCKLKVLTLSVKKYIGGRILHIKKVLNGFAVTVATTPELQLILTWTAYLWAETSKHTKSKSIGIFLTNANEQNKNTSAWPFIPLALGTKSVYPFISGGTARGDTCNVGICRLVHRVHHVRWALSLFHCYFNTRTEWPYDTVCRDHGTGTRLLTCDTRRYSTGAGNACAGVLRLWAEIVR